MGLRLPVRFGRTGRLLWRGIAGSSNMMGSGIDANPTQASTSVFNTSPNSTSRRSGMALLTSCHLQDQQRWMGMSSQNVHNSSSQSPLCMVMLLCRSSMDTHAAAKAVDAGRECPDEACSSSHHKVFTTQWPQDCVICCQEVRPYGGCSPIGTDPSYRRWGQDVLSRDDQAGIAWP